MLKSSITPPVDMKSNFVGETLEQCPGYYLCYFEKLEDIIRRYYKDNMHEWNTKEYEADRDRNRDRDRERQWVGRGEDGLNGVVTRLIYACIAKAKGSRRLWYKAKNTAAVSRARRKQEHEFPDGMGNSCAVEGPRMASGWVGRLTNSTDKYTVVRARNSRDLLLLNDFNVSVHEYYDVKRMVIENMREALRVVKGRVNVNLDKDVLKSNCLICLEHQPSQTYKATSHTVNGGDRMQTGKSIEYKNSSRDSN
ncbi:hypothetical protein V1477_020442 [Vespula maculifrons]|uniref:Uncharacterized protein n=1 Tax=Vespula maculifrons TaxID=7453 RepID=A0ABD2ALX1_VESMC